MLTPEILEEDLLIVPDNDTDLRIWLNESLIMVEEKQPLLYRYLDQLVKVNGETSACGALMTFLAIEHSLSREAFGG